MVIIDLLKWFTDIGSKLVSQSEKKIEKQEINRKNFFNSYIETSFEELGKIHQDYIESFYELLKIYRGHKIGDEAVIDYLLDRKAKTQFLRDNFTKYSQSEWTKSELFKRISESSDLKDESERVAQMINDYISQLANYFYSPVENISWYTDFLEMLKTRIRLVRNRDLPMPEKPIINAINDSIEPHIIKTIEDITIKYKLVCGSYAKLKNVFWV